MLVFNDPKVISSLCRILIAYSRIGEQINIIVSPVSLRLSIVNSSLTVLGETVVPSKFYEGRENVNVYVKAKATEIASRVISRGKPVGMEWGFIISASGEELLEIRALYDTGVKKTLFSPCIQTVAPHISFPPASDTPFSFECLTSRLRDAFSHCDLGADEIKFSFLSDLVNIHTRKLNRISVRRSRGIVNSSGLSTTVSLDPKIFNQITTRTPRQVIFKFKEFRTVIGFFNRIGERMKLRATFNGNKFASTTILDLKVVSPVFPEFEYTFKFLSKLSSDSNSQTGWLKIGRQPGWAYDEMNSEVRGTPRLFLSEPPTQDATSTGSSTLSAHPDQVAAAGRTANNAVDTYPNMVEGYDNTHIADASHSGRAYTHSNHVLDANQPGFSTHANHAVDANYPDHATPTHPGYADATHSGNHTPSRSNHAAATHSGHHSNHATNNTHFDHHVPTHSSHAADAHHTPPHDHLSTHGHPIHPQSDQLVTHDPTEPNQPNYRDGLDDTVAADTGGNAPAGTLEHAQEADDANVEEVFEVGYTQGAPSNVRGLFD